MILNRLLLFNYTNSQFIGTKRQSSQYLFQIQSDYYTDLEIDWIGVLFQQIISAVKKNKQIALINLSSERERQNEKTLREFLCTLKRKTEQIKQTVSLYY